MAGKRISLVLGSGGARGLAHIGVIRCLEERGYDIRCIAGSSMGALVGGIYAAGRLDTYAEWVQQLERGDVLRLLDWSFSRASLFKGERIIGVLEDLIGSRNIEDLPIRFTAVAADLMNEREVWLKHGPLFDAIRASIAIPAVFAPVEHDGRLLVDGSLVNPVPIAPTLNDDTELTVAVLLNGPPDDSIADGAAEPVRVEPPSGGYRAAIGRFLESIFESDPDPAPEREPTALDLIMRSMDAMQAQIGRLKLAAYSPDVIIEIPRNACGFFDFHRAREMIACGRRRAAVGLDAMARRTGG